MKTEDYAHFPTNASFILVNTFTKLLPQRSVQNSETLVILPGKPSASAPPVIFRWRGLKPGI